MIESFADLSLKLDMVSSPVVSVAAGAQANIDYTFTQARYLTGAEYFKSGGNFEDRITFQMVHPIYGVVDQFATDLLMKTEGLYQFYKATVPAGLIARAVYKNNGANEAKFGYNLVCHKDK